MTVVIAGTASGFLFNTGQACTAASRLLVEDSIFEELTSGVADVARSAKIGPGLDPSSEIGPLISDEQLCRVAGYIEQGLRDGARTRRR